MTIDQLLAKWLGKEGGAERANYQMFLTELCQALGVATPQPKGSGLGDYEFEAPVRSEAALGTKGTGRIDLYKRDHFILEAKQTQVREGEALPEDPPEAPPEPVYDLFGNAVGVASPSAKRVPRYDQLMAKARVQAERYALALPEQHDTPPFLIVADIGRGFELYFDWSGNGRGYGFFPDQRNYRVTLEDLKSDRKLRGPDKTPVDILRAIWTDPNSIDPRARAVEVTTQVAERLSRVAKFLEQTKRGERPGESDQLVALGIEQTSLFVMRLLFCMFAEDVDLLPKGRFTALLEEAREISSANEKQGREFWRNGLEELWRMMAQRGDPRPYWTLGRSVLRYFNGNLFSDRTVYDLSPEYLGELVVAAKKEWKNVEPAIFGTLLEQVLTTTDRSKLGAHYTPRAYVERLIQATVMDVIEPDWQQVRDSARATFEAGDAEQARSLVAIFHEELKSLAILDPACGTGNFLYVAMEQLLRLEGETIQLAAEFGAVIEPAVHPNQFLGLELNPRAGVIAELVLWIGWLRHRLANHPDSIGDPVLPPLTNINGGTHGGFDAVLVRTETGEPDTDNPRRPEWPEADFIVGNPPFIGGKDIRERLGSDYAEALWKANPRVPKSADFVMQWWDRAADILTRPGTRLRRFGLVTTNSITQVFSRRVIERWLSQNPLHQKASNVAKPEPTSEPPHPDPLPAGEREKENQGLSLILAIADHPWTRAAKDSAAVRIAMTVAEAGAHEGRLIEITDERGLDSDNPELDEQETVGRINADLTVGTDVTAVVPLRANEGLCSPGVKLHGAGFIVSPAKARELGLGRRKGLEQHIRPYLNGRDLLQRSRGMMVIDLYGLREAEVMEQFPEVYQHLMTTVKVGRADQVEKSPTADSKAYLETWWIFGKPRSELRRALAGLRSYIATTETSKHRIFQRLDGSVLPDNMIVATAAEDWSVSGVLQSSFHQQWSLQVGGWLGFGNDNRYNKSKVFDPFPFPAPDEERRAAIASVAEQLETTRKAALAEDNKLTMTGLYNLIEAVRSGTLPPEQEQAATRARARIVAKLHDDLDQAVADAYGWGEEWRRAPLPPGEIVRRLVALNHERAEEERNGKVRWLRPDYQVPRFARDKAGPGSGPG